MEASARGPRWWQVARHGTCPACGTPAMVWQGPTIVAPTCAHCGQALAEHEASGRALYPVVLPIVILLVLAALRLDAVWQPPLWIVALVWAPVALVLVGAAVRLVRAGHLAARIPARDAR